MAWSFESAIASKQPDVPLGSDFNVSSALSDQSFLRGGVMLFVISWGSLGVAVSELGSIAEESKEVAIVLDSKRIAPYLVLTDDRDSDVNCCDWLRAVHVNTMFRKSTLRLQWRE